MVHSGEENTKMFFNCRILRGSEIVRSDIFVSKGKIVDGSKLGYLTNIKIDCHNAIISPGFIDLQINGAFGVDFLTCSRLDEGLARVRRLLPSTGTTAFCPTLITSPPQFFHSVIPKIPRSSGSAEVGAAVLGLHLEGPFINKERKGAHPEECIADFDEGFESVKKMYGEANLGHVSIVTLAAEKPRSLEVVRELTSRGIVVSLGHSACDLETAVAAVAAGARKITHLFNAMPGFHHRQPSITGLLVSDCQTRVFAGIIADGIHTHPAALRIAHRIQPSCLLLVTDAICPMGLGAGAYNLGKTNVEVSGQPLRATVGGTTTLAGSVASMDYCIRQFRDAVGCSTAEALIAATLAPARCLGIEASKGKISEGADADLVILDDDLNILRTYIGGELAFDAKSPPEDWLKGTGCVFD